MSVGFDLAGHVRLLVESRDPGLQAAISRHMDPFPADSSLDGAEVPSLLIHELAAEPRAAIELQLAAGDGFVTASDGSALYVTAGGRQASVPDAVHDDAPRIGVQRGYPLSGLFRSVVRPSLQLRALSGGSVAVHAAAVAVDGRAVLVGGWSESGKTETALSLLEEGASFITDKWTFLGGTGRGLAEDSTVTASAFPISVGVRRWVLRYLPRLRSSLPARARAQLAAAGTYGVVTAPLRRRQGGRLGTAAAGARRLGALADRVALTPTQIADAYGHRPVVERLPVALVAVLRTVPEGSVSVREADAGPVAQRLAASAVTERAAYHALRTRARYALATPADPWELAGRESARLEDLLARVTVVEVSAPFPTDPRRVAAALRPWLSKSK